MIFRRFDVTCLVAVLLCATSLPFKVIAEEPEGGIQTKSPETPATGQRLDIYGDPLPSGAVARFGSLRLKHKKPGVHAVCFSPDGKMIASGGEDRTVRLWEAGTGKLIHVFEGHRFPITSVAISPKGDLLASGDERGGLMLWRLKDYSMRYEDHELGSRDMKLAFSPDGATLAAVDQRFALILIPTDTPSRAKRFRFRDFRPFWSAWSRDGETMALLGRGINERRDLLLIDSHFGQILAEPESEPRISFPEHCSIILSPIDGTLITADSFSSSTRPDGGSGLTVWKRADGKFEEIHRIAPGKGWGRSCSALSHHPKEPWVAYLRGDLLILHNWKTLEVVGTAVTERGVATAFSPDGRFLATAGAVLRVWTVPDLKPVFKYHPDTLPVSFSKDSRKAAVGSVLWDLKTYQPLHAAEDAYAQMGHTHFATRSRYIAPPNGVRIVGGEKTFAYSFSQQRLLVTAIEHAKPLVDFRLPKEGESNSFGINYVDFSENMERVVFRTRDEEKGARYTTVRISDGAEIHQFSTLNPKSNGFDLALSPDGRTLAVIDGSATSNGKELFIINTATGMAKKLIEYDDDRLLSDGELYFSKSGKHLALCFPHTRSYLIFGIPEGKQVLSELHPVASLTDPLAYAVRLREPAFSEDDRLFAVAEGEFTSERPLSFQAKISVWDLKMRERLWTQDWGTELPGQLSFAGDHLIVAGKRLALWDAASGRLVLDKMAPVQKSDDNMSYQTGMRLPNGQLLAGRSDGVTELIDLRSKKQVGELIAHGVPVESYHFTPNSRQVIITYQDRTALVWDLPAIAESAR